jgi:hypothetical protein
VYKEVLLVARGIRELELGVQKSQENGHTKAYNGVQQNENCVQLSVGDSHVKLVVAEESELSLRRLCM